MAESCRGEVTLRLALRVEDQFLLGNSLMVAPMLTPGTRRSVYLPRGVWVDFWTGDILQGSRMIEAACPIDHIPVYAAQGSAIPVGPALEFIQSDFPTVRGLMVFGEGRGSVRVISKHGWRELRYAAVRGRLTLHGLLVGETDEVRLAGLPEGIRVLSACGSAEEAELTW